jgi:hypothetical protein
MNVLRFDVHSKTGLEGALRELHGRHEMAVIWLHHHQGNTVYTFPAVPLARVDQRNQRLKVTLRKLRRRVNRAAYFR